MLDANDGKSKHIALFTLYEYKENDYTVPKKRNDHSALLRGITNSLQKLSRVMRI